MWAGCKPSSHKGLYDSLPPDLIHSTGWFKTRNSQRQREPQRIRWMHAIARAGRPRWKIEESFNCLACHGYNIKRNFGYGHAGLANLLATLNLFALALHAVMDCVSDLWRQCRQRAGTRCAFFEELRHHLTQWLCFHCWAPWSRPCSGNPRPRICPCQRLPHARDAGCRQSHHRPTPATGPGHPVPHPAANRSVTRLTPPATACLRPIATLMRRHDSHARRQSSPRFRPTHTGTVILRISAIS